MKHFQRPVVFLVTFLLLLVLAKQASEVPDKSFSLPFTGIPCIIHIYSFSQSVGGFRYFF
jgi:hypothetical protein